MSAAFIRGWSAGMAGPQPLVIKITLEPSASLGKVPNRSHTLKKARAAYPMGQLQGHMAFQVQPLEVLEQTCSLQCGSLIAARNTWYIREQFDNAQLDI